MSKSSIFLPVLAWLLAGCYAAAWNPDKLDHWSEQELSQALLERIPDLRDSQRVRVLVFGDSGKPDTFEDVARWMAQACADDCDFALMLGDNFYLRGPSKSATGEFEKHFKEPLLRYPEVFDEMSFWVVLGNHGYVWLLGGAPSDPALQLQYTHLQDVEKGPYWLMPAHQYSIPKLPPWLSVVGFDSFFASDNRSFDGDEADYQAVREEYVAGVYDLLTAKGEAGWHVLFGHHPHVTVGAHYKGNRLRGVPDPFDRLDPLIYFSGHDHDQQLIDDGQLLQVVQGAASKTRAGAWGSEKARDYFNETIAPTYEALDKSISAEYCERLGFAIATFEPDRFVLTFYWGDHGARAISGSQSWAWTKTSGGELVRDQPPPGAFRDVCPADS